MKTTIPPLVSSFAPVSSTYHRYSNINKNRTLPGQNDRKLPTIFISLYFLYLWEAPLIPAFQFKWYLALALSVGALLILKRSLHIRAARIFWVTYGLNFFGAILSLLRSSDPTSAAWNTVGMAAGFFTYLFFIPVLANIWTRKFLLFIIMVVGFLWSFEIFKLLNTYGYLIYSTFGNTGADKNHIGMCFALASTILFYLGIIVVPSTGRHGKTLLSLLCIGGSLYFLYTTSLIYARSGILSILLGFIIVLVLAMRQVNRKVRKLQIALLFLLISAAIVLLLIPKVVNASPYWTSMIEEFNNLGIAAYDKRTSLIKKGIYLISENPFVGVGIGGTRSVIYTPFDDYPRGLIHNTFLTEWAEKGLLGLLSICFWLIPYARIIRYKFFTLSATDQIWLIVFFIVIVEMNFLDIHTMWLMMLTIFAGIYYDLEIKELWLDRLCD